MKRFWLEVFLVFYTEIYFYWSYSLTGWVIESVIPLPAVLRLYDCSDYLFVPLYYHPSLFPWSLYLRSVNLHFLVFFVSLITLLLRYSKLSTIIISKKYGCMSRFRIDTFWFQSGHWRYVICLTVFFYFLYISCYSDISPLQFKTKFSLYLGSAISNSTLLLLLSIRNTTPSNTLY